MKTNRELVEAEYGLVHVVRNPDSAYLNAVPIKVREIGAKILTVGYNKLSAADKACIEGFRQSTMGLTIRLAHKWGCECAVDDGNIPYESGLYPSNQEGINRVKRVSGNYLNEIAPVRRVGKREYKRAIRPVSPKPVDYDQIPLGLADMTPKPRLLTGNDEYILNLKLDVALGNLVYNPKRSVVVTG